MINNLLLSGKFMLLSNPIVQSVLDTAKSSSDSTGGDFGQKIDTLGATGYNLAVKVGIWIAIIGVVIAGISFLISSGQERADKKKELIFKLVGIILIVGAVAIVGALATLSNSIFAS